MILTIEEYVSPLAAAEHVRIAARANMGSLGVVVAKTVSDAGEILGLAGYTQVAPGTDRDLLYAKKGGMEALAVGYAQTTWREGCEVGWVLAVGGGKVRAAAETIRRTCYRSVKRVYLAESTPGLTHECVLADSDREHGIQEVRIHPDGTDVVLKVTALSPSAWRVTWNRAEK